jgi:hypothetical protein
MTDAALDHVLRLVAAAECGESLVLRGSMAMLAWIGDGARPPRDLDWTVRASRRRRSTTSTRTRMSTSWTRRGCGPRWPTGRTVEDLDV